MSFALALGRHDWQAVLSEMDVEQWKDWRAFGLIKGGFGVEELCDIFARGLEAIAAGLAGKPVDLKLRPDRVEALERAVAVARRQVIAKATARAASTYDRTAAAEIARIRAYCQAARKG